MNDLVRATVLLAVACGTPAQPAPPATAAVIGAPGLTGEAPPVARSGPDYTKRALVLDAAIRTRLVGKWTNPVDNLVIEITSVDLASGQLRGLEWPTSGPSANVHELVGWVNAAPSRDSYDNVVPISFSTTLYEYGTLPTWAGFLRDDKLVTTSLLIWPSRAYAWDHISTFQETWTKIP
jgi:hypothetical protein